MKPGRLRPEFEHEARKDSEEQAKRPTERPHEGERWPHRPGKKWEMK